MNTCVLVVDLVKTVDSWTLQLGFTFKDGQDLHCCLSCIRIHVSVEHHWILLFD